MSFGGGGFGFGQNNNTQPPAFGTFGASNTNTGSAFGSGNTSTFGANTNPNTAGTAAGSGLFGSGGAFGNTGGAFGSSTTNNTFGAKPAFGTNTTSGGSLFGASTSTAGNPGFGGFGATNNNTATGGFGGTASLFGGNKTGTFGSGNTGGTGTSLFGAGAGGATASSSAPGFGGGATGAFGATNNPGIGGNIGDAPGTGNVPFTPTLEKEANNPTQQNSYQNILFMEPYKKWSAEELRLSDYNQGRRHGNATGSGAFGVPSSFGSTAFGAASQPSTNFGTGNTGGMFGTTQPSTGAFGTTTGAFGTGGGGLFNQQSKPTPAGGLFGSTTQPAQSGGLFGSTGGFSGTTNNTFGSANTTGGGLFGAAATPNKPSGFSFGTGAAAGTASNPGFGNTTTPNTGFGTTNTGTGTGTGLFGNTGQASTGGGLFGTVNQQQTASPFGGGGGAFGSQPNQQQTGSALFGNTTNQQKPAGGLFGNTGTTTTGGGLFGAGSNNTGSPFGGANTNQPSNSLFGAPKPAGNTGGIFGTGTQGLGNTAGGGLFGNLGASQQPQQQQQPAQSSLFNGMGQSQQKPSLFGNTTQQPGSGIFGGQPNQTQGGGLFGTVSTQQQPQATSLGTSIFNTSQGAQSTPQSLTTSISDASAYGSSSLFQNLGSGEYQNPGPLATPLSSNKQVRRPSILPMYRLNPGSANKYATPQKRGYGLSYSTYGSPSTPSSVGSTPGGLGQSLLLGGSIGRNMGKNISSSNLRRSFNVEESILVPGAFANAGPRHYGSTGNVKKLVINRDLRSDLFASPTKGKESNDASESRKLAKRVSFDTRPLAAIENGTQEAIANGSSSNGADLGFLRPSKSANDVNGARVLDSLVEAEQVTGNELAIVHEEEAAVPVPKPSDPYADKVAGEYWMRPTKEEIQNMNRMQRQKVVDFTIGREHVGQIQFRVPVDLSNIDLDDVINTVVILQTRSATVYPNAAKKPPVGKGLNVPAEISLEQSWPRGRDRKTPVHDKSGHRLAKHIERLRRIEGTTFVSYDENTGVWIFTVEHFTTYGLEGEDDDETNFDATAEPTAEVPTPTPTQFRPSEETAASPEVDPDDTFDFRHKRIALPGAFDYTVPSDDETDEKEQSFLSDRSAGSASYEVMPYQAEDQVIDGEYDMSEGQEETGLALVQHQAVEHENIPQYYEPPVALQETPGGIMRARLRAIKDAASPLRLQVADGDDWANMLQKSVSPQKRTNRAALKALHEEELYGAAQEEGRQSVQGPVKWPNVPEGRGFATSLDLMNSLFERARDTSQNENVPARAGGLIKWPSHDEENHSREPLYKLNGAVVSWDKVNQVPSLSLPLTASLHTLDPGLLGDDKKTWELASILFDDATKLRRATLSGFWKNLVHEATSDAIATAPSSEEKAVVCLAGHRIPEACRHLRDSRNVKLGALLALISASDQSRLDMQEQIEAWQRTNVLAEVTEPIRAIYSLLSGKVAVCEGKKDVAIENRMDSFAISNRFSLDWKQAFGLRLWYALSVKDDITMAVKMFKRDIDRGVEKAPEDMLWGLLQLYAGVITLEETLNPERGLRICWLLGQALTLTRKATFTRDPKEKADALTLAYVDQKGGYDAQVHGMTTWTEVSWILLHLVDPVARGIALKNHIGRNVELIFADWISTFASLSADMAVRHREGVRLHRSSVWKELHIPERWGYEALALFARARGDSHVYLEAFALLKARLFADAHRVVVDKIAPGCLIEHNRAAWLRLSFFLEQFRGHEAAVPEWNLGGGIYLKYLGLMNKGGEGAEREALALIDRHARVLGGSGGRGGGGNLSLSDIARAATRESPMRWNLEKAAGLYEALLVGN